MHLLNSDRKKISLTGCINYVGGKQNVHLCLKINKTRQKCHVNCVGGMPKGNVATRIASASGKLYNDQRFSTKGNNKGAGRRITRRYITLGARLVPDVSGLRGRKRPELYKTRKSKENLRWYTWCENVEIM